LSFFILIEKEINFAFLYSCHKTFILLKVK
jgi:hypothetical protein